MSSFDALNAKLQSVKHVAFFGTLGIPRKMAHLRYLNNRKYPPPPPRETPGSKRLPSQVLHKTCQYWFHTIPNLQQVLLNIDKDPSFLAESSLRTTALLGSYISNSLIFLYHAFHSTCCQNLEKNGVTGKIWEKARVKVLTL